MNPLRLSLPRSALSLAAAWLAALAALAGFTGFISAAPAAEKTRVIVLTDIGGREPDDEQSLIRLLAYSNHFDIEALIANTFVLTVTPASKT